MVPIIKFPIRSILRHVRPRLCFYSVPDSRQPSHVCGLAPSWDAGLSLPESRVFIRLLLGLVGGCPRRPLWGRWSCLRQGPATGPTRPVRASKTRLSGIGIADMRYGVEESGIRGGLVASIYPGRQRASAGSGRRVCDDLQGVRPVGISV